MLRRRKVSAPWWSARRRARRHPSRHRSVKMERLKVAKRPKDAPRSADHGSVSTRFSSRATKTKKSILLTPKAFSVFRAIDEATCYLFIPSCFSSIEASYEIFTCFDSRVHPVRYDSIGIENSSLMSTFIHSLYQETRSQGLISPHLCPHNQFPFLL